MKFVKVYRGGIRVFQMVCYRAFYKVVYRVLHKVLYKKSLLPLFRMVFYKVDEKSLRHIEGVFDKVSVKLFFWLLMFLMAISYPKATIIAKAVFCKVFYYQGVPDGAL